MDFSIPGSDSWDTTADQEKFIETYFHNKKCPRSAEEKKMKKKKKIISSDALIDSQKKKQKMMSLYSTKPSSILISESCYEPQQTFSFQCNDTSKSEEPSQSSDDSGVLNQIKIKKTKKQTSKMKLSKSHLPETAVILKRKNFPGMNEEKQCFREAVSNPGEIITSEKDDSDDVTIESDEDLLREEIKNCDIFKKLQKVMKKQPSINILSGSDLSDLLSDDDELSEKNSPKPDVSLPVDSSLASVKSVPHSFGRHITKQDNEDTFRREKSARLPKINSHKTSEELVVSATSVEEEGIEHNFKETLTRNMNSKGKPNNSSMNKAWEKLRAAKFRYLNEKLYTETGENAFKYFKENPEEFHDYHIGYSLQVSKWPMNPVDRIISDLQKLKKNAVIADLGCGDAKIARTLKNAVVHSFDLVAINEHVTACDFAKIPLPTESVDIAVFCLSLMGVNLKEYLREAHRILKMGGTLKIAEVESRILDIQDFIKNLKCFGFTLENQNLEHKIFVFLDLKKEKKKLKNSNTPNVTLRACLYKKR